MRVISLNSGSNGNCTYVQAGNLQLLIDAGISGNKAETRLAEHGHAIREIDALLITHDHRDHAGCMGIYNRKFGLPVHVTDKTMDMARSHYRVGPMNDIRLYRTGETIQLDGLVVETFPTPHDCADGVVFVLDDGEHRLGILTDLGHLFDGLAEIVTSLDAVLLESNYDPNMLARGFYPESLKRRIRGPEGHISNDEAAQLLHDAASPDLQWACLAHLSEHNNSPRVALETHQRILNNRFPIHIAPRHETTGILEI
jgi:phosphoribosyl 1,2-cyclic phosphodiesterase